MLSSGVFSLNNLAGTLLSKDLFLDPTGAFGTESVFDSLMRFLRKHFPWQWQQGLLRFIQRLFSI